MRGRDETYTKGFGGEARRREVGGSIILKWILNE
jgi:hypothetical protein